MKKTSLHTSLCTFCFITLFLFLASNSLLCFANSQSTVFSNVLRLHIIASSDSENDQALKLCVRDDILKVTNRLFENCNDITQALEIARENERLLLETAKNTVTNYGSDTKVTLKISKEHYPEKNYGELTFPKGEYLSLRIILGSGRGKNWWCVLFPPMCRVGIIEPKETLSNYGFDKEEIEKLETGSTKGINIANSKVSLKLLELFL